LENLVSSGKFEIAKEILNKKEIQSFLPQALEILKRKDKREILWNTCLVLSKTDLSLATLDMISKYVDTAKENIKVNIDDKMSAGVIIKNGSKYINATFNKVLDKALS
jgi:F0F1-type ATP synthase delta subunit